VNTLLPAPMNANLRGMDILLDGYGGRARTGKIVNAARPCAGPVA
jgi:hypothetical protein